MAINVSMTGSGEIGEILPGWSIDEPATPFVIGSAASGHGTVAIKAQAKPNSAFIVNNNITTTVDVGSVTGVVKNVSVIGPTVSMSHDTPLAKYDGERYIPPIIEGSVHSALDMVNQLANIDTRLARPNGNFWSLAGHIAGFNSANERIDFKEYYSLVDWWDSQGNPTAKQRVIINRDSPYCLSFSYIGSKIYADYLYGDTLSIDPVTPVNRITWKTIKGTNTSSSIGFEGLPDSSNISSGFNIGVGVDYSTGEAFIAGDYRYGGMPTDVNQRLDISTLNLNEELAVFVTFNNETVTPTAPYNYQLTIKVCNTSNYSVVKTLTWTMDSAYVPFIRRWYINGYVRALWTRNDNDVEFIGEWENEPSYNIEAPVIAAGLPTRGAVGGNLNMWQYLQEACAAYGQEIAVVNGVVTVRLAGVNEIDVTEHVASISLNPTSTLTGTSVDIAYTNSQGTTASNNYSNRDVIYNAYNDQNRVLTVKVGETIKTTIDTGNALIAVLTPRQTTTISNITTGKSWYVVSSQDGTAVSAALWEAYGGGLSVSINPDNDKAIDVKLIGPYTTIPGTTAPYSVSYKSGEKDYAGMVVSGTALKITSQTLSLQTGADPTKTAGATTTKVNNRFISKIEQAYDRGIWVSSNASGPRVNIRGTIPVSAIDGLGLVAGSRIRYMDSIYRITDVNIGNLSVDFDATRHVTVADFDAKWAGRTVATHDGVWAGMEVQDQMIAPLYFIGDDEGVIMLLDTDVNPYYDFSGEPEISVFPDTDMNPFYEDGGNLDGEDPVKLDVDNNPYDDGAGYGS